MKVVHCEKDPYDVYIGRPTFWGNPYSHLENTLAKYKVKTRKEAIENHARDIWNRVKTDLSFKKKIYKELSGKTLGCWCKPKSCHGDVYVDIIKWIESNDVLYDVL